MVMESASTLNCSAISAHTFSKIIVACSFCCAPGTFFFPYYMHIPSACQ